MTLTYDDELLDIHLVQICATCFANFIQKDTQTFMRQHQPSLILFAEKVLNSDISIGIHLIKVFESILTYGSEQADPSRAIQITLRYCLNLPTSIEPGSAQGKVPWPALMHQA